MIKEDDVANRAAAQKISTDHVELSCRVQFRWLPAKGQARLLLIVLSILLSSLFPAWPQEVSQNAPKREQQPAHSGTPRQTTSSNPEALEGEITPPGLVVIDGRQIVAVFEPVGNVTPEERAAAITGRIIAAARDGGEAAERVSLQEHEGWTAIVAGEHGIMVVTNGDAKMAGKPLQQLAKENGESIRQAIVNYRWEHSWRMLLRGILKTMCATFLLLPVLWLTWKVRWFVRGQVERRIQASARAEKKSAWHFSVAHIGPVLLGLGALVRWLFIFAVVETYLTITLSFFSSTRDISATVTRWVASQLASLARSGLDYLPNLLVIAVIVVTVHYLIRLIRVVFGEIRKGDLKIKGFYPDWAEPTEKLIRMLILVLALVVMFPYLPGAKSPAFQGVSIFLGVLLSLGSSSAVANAIAGIILTYMRSFLVGDWVQIGDVTGEVSEKTLLVTRVVTPKAEVITIPNASVMSAAVKNYSIEAKRSGVIFHTCVTIGYDAPWRTVHQLLISAALATAHVLKEPAPFVLQKSLDDFYVAYELNAYTDVPIQMLAIYSELHQNIQDKFNEAGVEICSPHFSSLRDGNSIAIPQQYVRREYTPPSFRISAAQEKEETEKAAGV